jgi:hypothetical protein
MRVGFIALALSLPLSAQINVTLTQLPESATRALLGSKVGKQVSVWSATVENDSNDGVAVTEAAIVRRVSELQPLDHAAMALLVNQASQKSGWAKAGATGSDMIKSAAFVMGMQGVKSGSVAMLIATGITALGPGFVQQLQGMAIPVETNFEGLAWITPLNLQPGESGTAHLFTKAWAQGVSRSFVIQTNKMGMRKVVQ